MQLSQVIARIRGANTIFADRVAGAAEAAVALDKGALVLPAAYVVPLADTASTPARTDSSRRQQVVESVGVLVVLDNRTPAAGGPSDERGQAAADQAQAARADLWRALLTWCPAPEQSYEPVYYVGSELTLIDDARLAILFTFAAEFSIDVTDALPTQAPDFTALDLKLDVIDPAADPNRSYPGPDGRIEVEAPVTLPPDAP